jgi:solute carrier family 25 phosphate transporter 23/24/25/41
MPGHRRIRGKGLEATSDACRPESVTSCGADTRAAATYPLDLVRARLSIATSNLAVRGAGGAGSGAVASAFTPEDAKLGILGMTKKVYRTEGGLRGL